MGSSEDILFQCFFNMVTTEKVNVILLRFFRVERAVT